MVNILPGAIVEAQVNTSNKNRITCLKLLKNKKGNQNHNLINKKHTLLIPGIEGEQHTHHLSIKNHSL